MEKDGKCFLDILSLYTLHLCHHRLRTPTDRDVAADQNIDDDDDDSNNNNNNILS